MGENNRRPSRIVHGHGEATPAMDDANDHEAPTQSPGPETIDPARVAALYVEHGQELRRFVMGLVRDLELTADVMQATFTKAVERGHTAREPSLKAWLFQVAYHEALTARRRQATREKFRDRLSVVRRGQDHSPEDGLIRGETVEAVRQALSSLPAEQRNVVFSRIYEDKTFATIAEESGLPLGTVITRMRLALEKLRRQLQAGD